MSKRKSILWEDSISYHTYPTERMGLNMLQLIVKMIILIYRTSTREEVQYRLEKIDGFI